MDELFQVTNFSILTPQVRRTPKLRFCVLLAGDAEAGEEDLLGSGPYTRP